LSTRFDRILLAAGVGAVGEISPVRPTFRKTVLASSAKPVRREKLIAMARRGVARTLKGEVRASEKRTKEVSVGLFN
jgi:hypothetical protein